jgi:hypothetical protein
VPVGIPEGKTPLGRPKCRWEEILKCVLKRVCHGVDWNRLRPVANAATNPVLCKATTFIAYNFSKKNFGTSLKQLFKRY